MTLNTLQRSAMIGGKNAEFNGKIKISVSTPRRAFRSLWVYALRYVVVESSVGFVQTAKIGLPRYVYWPNVVVCI